MKVVEFVGLPGVGKSTLCKMVIEKMPKRQNHVYTYNDLTYAAFSPRRRFLLRVKIYLSPSGRKFYRVLNKYASGYEGVELTTKLVIASLYVNMKHLARKDRHAEFFLDEGFVQNITSIAHMRKIKKDDKYYQLIDLIKESFDLFVIDCHAPIDIVIRRLRARGRKDRFNSIQNDEILKNSLYCKQRNLDDVMLELPSQICLDLSQSYKSLIDKIIECQGRKI